jgi:hypothetical protein
MRIVALLVSLLVVRSWPGRRGHQRASGLPHRRCEGRCLTFDRTGANSSRPTGAVTAGALLISGDTMRRGP